MNEKTALVTGGARGIGRAISIRLAEKGWKLILNDRGTREATVDTLSEIRACGSDGIVVEADISSGEDRNRLVEESLAQMGRIDLLVNNAGVAPRQRADLLEMTESSYDEVLATNMKGAFFLTQRIAKIMRGQIREESVRKPMIINIGSISAYACSTNRGEYCLSKAGLAMITSLFADRLAEDGILVYEVRPGIIATDMTSGVRQKYDALIESGLTPLRRWGLPDDVARAVVAIAEGAFPFSTGEVFNVDGGFHLRRL